MLFRKQTSSNFQILRFCTTGLSSRHKSEVQFIFGLFQEVYDWESPLQVENNVRPRDGEIFQNYHTVKKSNGYIEGLNLASARV